MDGQAIEQPAPDRQADNTVSVIMSAPVITIDADATLKEAETLLHHYGMHHLLVSDRRKVVAMLSDRDLLNHRSPFLGTLAERERDAHTLLRRVFQFASYELVTAPATMHIYEATGLMLDRDVSALPIVDEEGAFVGIVTKSDLLRGLLSCAVPAAPDATRRSA